MPNPQYYYYASKHRLSYPGQLISLIERFIDSLRKQEYSDLSVDKHASSIAHFGEWMEINDIPLTDIDQQVITQYGNHVCSCQSRRGRHPVNSRELGRVRQFVRMLRDQHMLSAVPHASVQSDSVLLEEYIHWLTDCRGLSISTVKTLKLAVTRLLPLLGNDPESYNVSMVREVVRTAAKQCTVSYAKTLCNALRSYLRFLATSNRCYRRWPRLCQPYRIGDSLHYRATFARQIWRK